MYFLGQQVPQEYKLLKEAENHHVMILGFLQQLVLLRYLLPQKVHVLAVR